MDPNIAELLSNPFFIAALIIEFILKGIALWKSARNNQMGWFIAIFIINSVGILPAIYLLAFQKKVEKH